MCSFRFEDHLTLSTLIQFQARVAGARIAIIAESENHTIQTFTYSEILDRAERASVMLASNGVKHSDKVHVHLGNRIEFIDCWLACSLIGAVIVPTGLTSVATEVAYVQEHSQAVITVVDSRDIDDVTSNGFPQTPILQISHDCDWLEGQNSTGGIQHLDIPVRSSDPLAVMYTSGTTSRPKGVVLTHANYIHVGEVTSQQLRIRPDDRWLVTLPLFHANAQFYSFMSAFTVGASVAMMSKFSASKWPDQVREYKATLASLFAAPIRMILSKIPLDSEPSVLNSLRVTLFAQNLTEIESERFETIFGESLLQLYGMTETVAPPLMNPLFGNRQHRSIGLPIINTLVRIRTDDGDESASNSQEGELMVYGEPGVSLMLEYLNDAAATSVAIDDGWLRTGDRVRVDDHGYFFFIDRLKDMVKRSGENVALSEIERVIEELPEVKESAVIGVPDDIHDFSIKAFVVREIGAQITAEDVREWCFTHLAKFKVPDEVVFLEALPRTSVGKIEKRSLDGV
jgi:carnitine-CoA ligase